jgi:hypothetical protein
MRHGIIRTNDQREVRFVKNVKLLYIAGTLFFSVLLAITFVNGSAVSSAQEPGQSLSLDEMTLYLEEGMGMSPLPPESGEEYQAISIPNGFVKKGLFNRNILPVGTTYWKDVGMWSTQPLRETINLGGEVEVVIYATREEGSDSVNSDFEFIILRGTEPLLVLGVTNQRIDDGVDNRITASDWFPSNNDTTVKAGTTISILIRAKCNGGAILKFGSSDVASGFHFGSNALQIQNIFMDNERITVEYQDAFMVPWIKLFTELRVNSIIQSNYEVGSEINTANRTRELIWDRESVPGQYEVFISLSYNYLGENNISYMRNLKVEEPHISGIQKFRNFVDLVFPYILITGILSVSFIFMTKMRKKIWRKRINDLPEPVKDLSYPKKKKEWKKMNKANKRRKMEQRRIDRERREREGFSLFKRNKRPSPTGPYAVADVQHNGWTEEFEL